MVVYSCLFLCVYFLKIPYKCHLFLAFFAPSRVACTNGELNGQLLVNDLPHFQTFDSWPQCNYPGTCYEQSCPTLLGGWKTGPFHGGPGSVSGIDQRHWWVLAGETSSNKFNVGDPSQGQPLPCGSLLTGPCFDHTLNNITGNYMYAECSACYGSTFTVYTPFIAYTGTGASISYWYYLYGAALAGDSGFVSSFTVEVSSDNGTTWQQLRQFAGNVQTAAQDPWFQDLLTIDGFLATTPSLANPVIVQYRFVSITGGERNNGDWWQGDMAFDDVLFTQNNAGNTTVPYIDPPPPVNNQTVNTPTPAPPPPDTVQGGDGGLSDGAIAGIVVGVIGGLCCLCCLLLLLVLIILLVVSPRKPPSKDGGGDGL